jgi:hypothetical protein
VVVDVVVIGAAVDVLVPHPWYKPLPTVLLCTMMKTFDHDWVLG